MGTIKRVFPSDTEPGVRVLFVSPYDHDRATIEKILSDSNWNLRTLATCNEAIRLIQQEAVPVIICERDAADGSWIELLRVCDSLRNPPRLIVCSRQADNEIYGEVVTQGGYELLSTPFDAGEVIASVALAWLSWNSDRRNTRHARRTAPNSEIPASESAVAG